MYITNFAKNQFDLKSKKNHVNSILSEVKNKLCIQEIDNQRKLNNSFVNFSQRVSKTGEFLMKKPSNIDAKHKKQENSHSNISNENTFSEDVAKIQQLFVLKSKKQPKLKRRSSKLEMQLEQIIKYSKMYPGSRKQIPRKSKNFNLLKQNSNFKPQSKVSNSKLKNSIFAGRSSQLKSSAQSKVKENKNKKNLVKINPDYLLKLIPSEKLIEEQDEESEQSSNSQTNQCKYSVYSRKKLDSNRIIQLLKRTKKVCQQGYRANNLSLQSIIQKNLAQINEHNHKNKEDRKTVSRMKNIRNSDKYFLNVMKQPLSFKRKRQDFSLQDQNINNFQNFVKGGVPIDQDIYDDFFNKKDINKHMHNFDIYNKTYECTIDKNKYKKTEPENINEQTLKNVFYLNQSLKKSHNYQVKKQLKEAMKRIRMIDFENNF